MNFTKYVSLLLFVFLVSSHVAAVTQLNHEVYDGFGGPLEAGTYLVTDQITVPRGETLTIEPGVVIKISRSQFIVGGVLDIEGTESNPVVFTGKDDDSVGEQISNSDGNPTAGDWIGILFEEGSIGNLSNLICKYSGREGDAIEVASSVTFADCEIIESASHGLTISNQPTDQVVVRNCTFQNNDGYAIYAKQPDSIVTSRFEGNAAQGNQADVIAATGTITTSGDISSDMPIFLLDDLVIGDEDPETATIIVNVSPGVIFKARNKGIIVHDQFDVSGEPQFPVLFTSDEDGAEDAGGDTLQGDNNPSAGQWSCLQYTEKSRGTLSYSVFRYGGSEGAALDIGSTVSVSNSEFTSNAAAGISISNATDRATIENCTFQNNGTYAIYAIHPNGLVLTQFENNSAQGNQADVLFATGEITKSGTIRTQIPIFFDETLTIGDTDEDTAEIIVNVSPGVIFKPLGSNLVVNDELNVDGSQESPVLFTSAYDTAQDAGGSTLANQVISLASGQWGQLKYNTGSDGNVRYAKFRYGGEASVAVLELNSAIRVSDCEISNNLGEGIFANGDVTLVDLTVQQNDHGLVLSGNHSSVVRGGIYTQNARDGIVVQESHSTTGTHITITKNMGNGVEISSTGDISITQSNIFSNNQWGVLKETINVVNFQENYWGDPSGPKDENTPVSFIKDSLNLYNPNSNGNRVTDFVDWSNPVSGSITTPTPTPTSTPTPTNTPEPTSTPTPTPTSEIMVTSTPTPTYTPSPTFTPIQTPIQEEGVFVLDNIGDVSGDFIGTTDFDTVENRNLTIYWNVPQGNATDWHVYVRKGFGGTKFLGLTGSGSVNRLDWYAGAPNLDEAFANGPDFNSVYTFRVIRIDEELGSDDYFEVDGPVGFNLEGGNPVSLASPDMPDVPSGQIAVCDDIFGIENLAPSGSTGSDVDQADWNALQIAWNFGEEAPEAKEYHVFVNVDGSGFTFLGQTYNGNLNYFWWTSENEFRTYEDFADGPQDGHSYQFRVYLVPLSGGNNLSLASGVLNYSIAN